MSSDTSTQHSHALLTELHSDSGKQHSIPYEKQLKELDISFWTEVGITNDAAVQAILLYLSSEHPIIGVFDADIWIEGLTAKNLRHCSHFLVSSMLCWACVSHSFKVTLLLCAELQLQHAYRTIDPSVPTDALREEAHARWLESQSREDATTAIAALFLHMSAASDGLSTLAEECLAHVMRISDALEWFHPSLNIPQDLDTTSANDLRANAHAAWGFFNFITYVSIYYTSSAVANLHQV